MSAPPAPSSRREATRTLLRILRRRWVTFTFDAVIGAAFFLLGMVPGLIAKAFFDTLTGHRLTWGMSAGLLIAALVLVKFLHVWLGIAWMYVDTALREALMSLLRRNLFARVLELPAARALPVPIGDALSRLMEDVRQSVETLCKRSGLMNLTSSLSFAAVAVAVMWHLNARVTVLALLPTLVVVLISYVAGQRVGRFRAASRQSAGEVGALLNEVFSSVQAIKLAGAEARVTDRVMRLNAARGAAAVRDNAFSIAVYSTSNAVLALGTGLILIAALDPIRQGSFTVGDLAAFIYLLTEVGIGVRVASTFMNSWRQAQVALGRVHELQQGQPLLALTDPAPTPGAVRSVAPFTELRVRGLAHRHRQTGAGLVDVDLQVRRGELVVITGRTGSGKTTLLHCVLGMLPLDAGEIRWNGELITDPATFFVPPRTAYTPQTPRIMSASVRANLLLGLDSPEAAQLEAARAAVFEQDLTELAAGWDTEVGPRGYQLSGGQAQRLAAARMFLRRPELLVIDDLSSALDAHTEAALWREIVGQTAAGGTCLAVSNRRHALARADRVIVLSEGRIVAMGPLASVLESSDQMQQIWRSEDHGGADGRPTG